MKLINVQHRIPCHSCLHHTFRNVINDACQLVQQKEQVCELDTALLDWFVCFFVSFLLDLEKCGPTRFRFGIFSSLNPVQNLHEY